MHRCEWLPCACALIVLACSRPQPQPESWTVANQELTVEIQRAGGAISRVTLAGSELNPLSLGLTREQMPLNNQSGAPFRGHFLCTGRWGAPTPGEIAAGIPHNGEPSRDAWTGSVKGLLLEARFSGALEEMAIHRTVRLAPQAPVFFVNETFSSLSASARIFNVVQHPTLGPPFLDADTRIDANAGPGFLQVFSFPDPEGFAYRWPDGIRDSLGAPLDLRRNEPFNHVSTHLFDLGVRQGWITAYAPGPGLVFGYVWQTDDYPWLNVWKHWEEDRPVALGMEFGTTGIGRTYDELASSPALFRGYPSFGVLDAGASWTRAYACFLLPSTGAWGGTESVTLTADSLILVSEGGEKMAFFLK